jgi:hypothetical protein
VKPLPPAQIIVDLTVRPDDERPFRMDGTCFFCCAPIGGQHRTGEKECVIVGFRVLEAATPGVPYPIDTYPAGHHALFWFPDGEKGVGGWEAATCYPDPGKPPDRGWTHGGPNSGSDWEFCEPPTHWARLPDPPETPKG